MTGIIPKAADQRGLISGIRKGDPPKEFLLSALSNPELAKWFAQAVEASLFLPPESSPAIADIPAAADQTGLISGSPRRQGAAAEAELLVNEFRLDAGFAAQVAAKLQPYLPDPRPASQTPAAVAQGLVRKGVQGKQSERFFELLDGMTLSDIAVIATQLRPQISSPEYVPIDQSFAAAIPDLAFYIEADITGGNSPVQGSENAVTGIWDQVGEEFYAPGQSPVERLIADNGYRTFRSSGGNAVEFGTAKDSTSWTIFFVGKIDQNYDHVIAGRPTKGRFEINFSRREILARSEEDVTPSGNGPAINGYAGGIPISLDNAFHCYCWQVDTTLSRARGAFFIDGQKVGGGISSIDHANDPNVTLDSFFHDVVGDSSLLVGYSRYLGLAELNSVYRAIAFKYQLPWVRQSFETALARYQGLASYGRIKAAVEAAALDMPSNRTYFDEGMIAEIISEQMIWVSLIARDTGVPVGPVSQVQGLNSAIYGQSSTPIERRFYSVENGPAQQQDDGIVLNNQAIVVDHAGGGLPLLIARRYVIIAVVEKPPLQDERQTIFSFGDSQGDDYVAIAWSDLTEDNPNGIVMRSGNDISGGSTESWENGFAGPFATGDKFIITLFVDTQFLRCRINSAHRLDRNLADELIGYFTLRLGMAHDGTQPTVNGKFLALIYTRNHARAPILERFLNRYYNLGLDINSSSNTDFFPEAEVPSIIASPAGGFTAESLVPNPFGAYTGFEYEVSQPGGEGPFTTVGDAGFNDNSNRVDWSFSGLAAGDYKTRIRMVYGTKQPKSDWVVSPLFTVS